MTSKLAPGGSVFITVRRDVRYQGYRTHKIHQKTTYQRNVLLNFHTVYVNDFCEIYQLKRKVDIPVKSACIFCRPSSKLKYIAESSNVYAVYDGYPVSKGHTLVIPKVHEADYFGLSSSLQHELIDVVAFVKKYLSGKYTPDGFNVGVNVGQAAGQTVFHVHIHIIPRYNGDTPNPRGGVRHVITGKGIY
jgi:diadenosine tetraphosphate (Ap4A) HIT family hydrolase